MKHRHKKCALLAKIRKNAESRRGAIMQLPKPQEEELNSKSYLSSDQFQETGDTLRAMRKKRKRVIKKRRSNEIEKKSRRKMKVEAKASDAKESNSQEGKTVDQSTTLSGPSPMKKIKLQRNRSLEDIKSQSDAGSGRTRSSSTGDPSGESDLTSMEGYMCGSESGNDLGFKEGLFYPSKDECRIGPGFVNHNTEPHWPTLEILNRHGYCRFNCTHRNRITHRKSTYTKTAAMDAQQAASLLQSAQNLSNSQLGNQLAQQLANFGQVNLIKSTQDALTQQINLLKQQETLAGSSRTNQSIVDVRRLLQEAQKLEAAKLTKAQGTVVKRPRMVERPRPEQVFRPIVPAPKSSKRQKTTKVSNSQTAAALLQQQQALAAAHVQQRQSAAAKTINQSQQLNLNNLLSLDPAGQAAYFSLAQTDPLLSQQLLSGQLPLLGSQPNQSSLATAAQMLTQQTNAAAIAAAQAQKQAQQAQQALFAAKQAQQAAQQAVVAQAAQQFQGGSQQFQSGSQQFQGNNGMGNSGMGNNMGNNLSGNLSKEFNPNSLSINLGNMQGMSLDQQASILAAQHAAQLVNPNGMFSQNFGQMGSNQSLSSQNSQMNQMSQSLSQSMGQSLGQNLGQISGQSSSQSLSQNLSQNLGQNQQFNQSLSQNLSQNQNFNLNQSLSQNLNQNLSQSLNQNLNQSLNQNLLNSTYYQQAMLGLIPTSSNSNSKHTGQLDFSQMPPGLDALGPLMQLLHAPPGSQLTAGQMSALQQQEAVNAAAAAGAALGTAAALGGITPNSQGGNVDSPGNRGTPGIGGKSSSSKQDPSQRLAQQLLKDSQAIALAQRNLSSDSTATQKAREQQAAVAAAANNQLVLDNSTSSPVQQPTGKQAQFNLMDADAQYILSLKESLPELLAPMKQSNKPGKWQDAHVRVAHLIHDSQIKDVQQKLADTIAKFETQNAGDLGNQGILGGQNSNQNFQNLGNMGQNLNLAQNLAQNQSLDQAILMQLKQQEAELKLQNSQLARQNSGTPNSKKRKTPTGGQSSNQMNPSNHQLASQTHQMGNSSSNQLLQSSQQMANSSSQNNNQSAKSIASSGTASLRATPTGNSNMLSSQIPASLSGAISNSSGIASGMPNLSGNLGGNMSTQQFAQHQAAANTALQAQALNFDNLEMTHAIAAALQQQQQLPTDVNVLQYLTAIDQMQAAGMKAPVSQTGSASTRTSGRGGKSSGIKQSSSSARLRQQAHAHAQQQQQAQQQAQQQVMLQQAALQMQLQQMQQHEAAQAAANAAAAKNKKS